MFVVSKGTYNNAVSRADSLKATVVSLSATVEELYREIDRLDRLNRFALPLVKRAQAGLENVFGPLENVQTDSDEYLVFDAASGLARLFLHPATSLIVIVDPNELVRGRVDVTLDSNGELDEDEQERIATFLATVMYRRNSGASPITGRVSLIAKHAPASSNDEVPANEVPEEAKEA